MTKLTSSHTSKDQINLYDETSILKISTCASIRLLDFYSKSSTQSQVVEFYTTRLSSSLS